MNNLILEITVRKQDGIVYQGQAKSLTSNNAVGPFDILPLHANFVSLISNQIEIIDLNAKPTRIPIKQGLLHVKNNTVKVYLGIAKPQP